MIMIRKTSVTGSAALPDGRTCQDCAHFLRCRFLLCCNPENEVCDWDPSRFVILVPSTSLDRAT